uniref:Uncharacterized protein n=1 Tax=Theileria annulata TaxID=5874 RepID=A0A3B0NCW9_THEAN
MNLIIFFLILSVRLASQFIEHKTHPLEKPNFMETGHPILTAVEILTGANDGRKEANFGGGNLGAYYNFMYPDNTDYPWACLCNMEDFKLWQMKKQPYVRCRNQEDLSYQDIQANCDPRNMANYEDVATEYILFNTF